MLKAFLEASYLGWRDVMDNPKSALEIFKKRVPEIDLSIIEPNMMMGLELMKTERYAKQGIGWMDETKMCASVDLVNTYMGVHAEGGVQGGLHQRVPDQDRAAEVDALSAGRGRVGRLHRARPRGHGVRHGQRPRGGAAGHRVRGGPGRARRPGRAQRVREVDAPAGRGGPAPADQRPGDGGWPAGDASARRAVGMVFQAPVLLKWRRLLDNVLLPAELAGLEPGRYRDRARSLLRLRRPRRVRRQVSARAVRRDATTGRALPRPAAGPAAAADGRALRRSGCHDP